MGFATFMNAGLYSFVCVSSIAEILQQALDTELTLFAFLFFARSSQKFEYKLFKNIVICTVEFQENPSAS